MSIILYILKYIRVKYIKYLVIKFSEYTTYIILYYIYTREFKFLSILSTIPVYQYIKRYLFIYIIIIIINTGTVQYVPYTGILFFKLICVPYQYHKGHDIDKATKPDGSVLVGNTKGINIRSNTEFSNLCLFLLLFSYYLLENMSSLLSTSLSLEHSKPTQSAVRYLF